MAAVRVLALVTAAVAAQIGLGRRQVEQRLGMALGTRDVVVGADQRHAGVALVVVVEVHRRLGRLPHALAVAALAREHVLALEAVRLVVLVARAARAIGAHVRAQALLVLGLVTVGARGSRVLALE